MFRSLLIILTIFSISLVPCQAYNRLTIQAKYKQEYVQLPESTKLWYKNLHNSKGQWCCDESDGEAYYDNYDLRPDGGVRLSNGTWIDREQVVLDSKNPTGHAVWFHNQDNTYCFVPGALN